MRLNDLPGSTGPYTLLEHCRDWAAGQGAPAAVADAYASYALAVFPWAATYVLAPASSGSPEMWASWRERNLSSCLRCGGPWALLCLDARPVCWQCAACGCSRPVPGGAA